MEMVTVGCCLKGIDVMYGYLRIMSGTTLPSIYHYYRSEYCTLCHALWCNYGLRPRFILSYDMTFLAVVLDLKWQVDLEKRLLCYKKAEFESDQEKWKQIAAMSILLAAKKLEDDIADENNLKAKIGMLIFRNAARRAEIDYPKIAEIFQKGFSDMTKMEKDCCDVFAMSRRFGDLMTEAMKELFNSPDEDLALMRHVTEWVYFIDALDDLEDDVRKKTFNPFKKLASNKNELLQENSNYLKKFISEQMTRFQPYFKYYSEGTARNWVIMSILNETIPYVTERVLKDEEPYRKTPIIAQAMQSKGGYKLA